MIAPLQNLLQQTDRTLAQRPRAIPAETLLTAAHRRRKHSKRRRMAVAGVTAALAGVAVTLVGSWQQIEAPRETRAVVQSRTPAHIDIPAPRTPEELRTEIAALDREAAWRTEMAKSIQLAHLATLADSQNLEDFDLASAASQSVPSLNNAEWLRVESARTAALSWHYAHMVEHEFHDLPAAVREYQRLVERFPGTPWAQRSQVSLDRILTSHNTPL